jgi:2'-5' RNA ligase
MYKYVIVSFLEEIPNGYIFNRNNWPLHLTIIRPFLSPDESDYFVEKLKFICSKNNRIQLTAKSEELFGLNKDIPVIELEMTGDLQNLHDEVKQVLKDSIEFESALYADFRPHVTTQGNKSIKVGEDIMIDSLSLVKSSGDTKEVISSIKFL